MEFYGADLDLLSQARRKEFLRVAEKERLGRQALAGLGKRPRVHQRVLDWLGRRLVMWGRRLQERYDMEGDTYLQLADHPR